MLTGNGAGNRQAQAMAIAVALAVKTLKQHRQRLGQGGGGRVIHRHARQTGVQRHPHHTARRAVADGVAEQIVQQPAQGGARHRQAQRALHLHLNVALFRQQGKKLAHLVHLLTHIQPLASQRGFAVFGFGQKQQVVHRARQPFQFFGIVGQHLLVFGQAAPARQGHLGLPEQNAQGRAHFMRQICGIVGQAGKRRIQPRQRIIEGIHQAQELGGRQAGVQPLVQGVRANGHGGGGERRQRAQAMAHQRAAQRRRHQRGQRAGPQQMVAVLRQQCFLIVAIAPDFQLHRLAIGQRGARRQPLPGVAVGIVAAQAGRRFIQPAPQAGRQGGRAVHQHRCARIQHAQRQAVMPHHKMRQPVRVAPQHARVRHAGQRLAKQHNFAALLVAVARAQLQPQRLIQIHPARHHQRRCQRGKTQHHARRQPTPGAPPISLHGRPPAHSPRRARCESA